MNPRPYLKAVSPAPTAAVVVRKPRVAPTGDSVKKLQARARSQARRIALKFAADLDALAAQAQEVAGLGDAAPAGVRELARAFASSAPFTASNVRKLAK